MTFFTARELLDLQAMDDSLRSEVFTITTTTTVSDGGGQSTETTSTRQVSGYFLTGSGQERTTEEQVRNLGRYRLRLSVEVELSPADRITRDLTGVEYSISYMHPVGTLDTAKEISLEEAP